MDQKLVEKINYYTKLSRKRPLTPAETADRQVLRQQYLAQFRQEFRTMLDNIEIVDDNKPN